MSTEPGVFALVNIRHHGRDYGPGDKIGRISKADADRLLELKAVRVVEEVAKEPPKPPIDPPPPPKETGGEGNPPPDRDDKVGELENDNKEEE